jgi:hypothetical protein
LALSPVIHGRAIDCLLFPWFLHEFTPFVLELLGKLVHEQVAGVI